MLISAPFKYLRIVGGKVAGKMESCSTVKKYEKRNSYNKSYGNISLFIQ